MKSASRLSDIRVMTDDQLNDEALKDGSRILSAYLTLKGKKLWILTEATNDDGHRESTTILLPDEY